MTRYSLLFFILVAIPFLASCEPAEVAPQTDTFTAAFVSAEPAGWELLELSPETDLRVYGLPLPAPERASVRALYHAVMVDSAGDSRRLPVDGPVQDVRIHAGTHTLVATLDAGGRLLLWDAQTTKVETLAENVFPGFSFSPDGHSISYAAGLIPEMDLHVVRLDSREVRRLTDENGPVWGPAYSPDGKEILFVSSTGGYPSLAVISADGGKARRLTNTDLPVDGSIVHSSRLAPFPDGRRPPLWTSEGVFFENFSGIYQVSMTGRISGHWPGVRFPILQRGRVVHFDGRRLMPLDAVREVEK